MKNEQNMWCEVTKRIWRVENYWKAFLVIFRKIFWIEWKINFLLKHVDNYLKILQGPHHPCQNPINVSSFVAEINFTINNCFKTTDFFRCLFTFEYFKIIQIDCSKSRNLIELLQLLLAWIWNEVFYDQFRKLSLCKNLRFWGSFRLEHMLRCEEFSHVSLLFASCSFSTQRKIHWWIRLKRNTEPHSNVFISPLIN